MPRPSSAALVACATWELLRYDLVRRLFGFRHVYRGLRRLRPAAVRCPEESVQKVCDAVGWACTLYWKRVPCLQRSAATVRLLRRRGFEAELVIGVRSDPFLGHAWVELGNRVINDAASCKELLWILDRV